MSKGLDNKVNSQIQELKANERRLFDIYNWKAPAEEKLRVLNSLIQTISKLEVLEKVTR